MEDELNKLHQEKMKNEAKAKDEFDKRVKEAKEKAIADNIKKAEESGNVLTQTLNDEGELVGVKDTIDFENRDVANDEDREARAKEVIENAGASAADIQTEFADSSKTE